MRFWGVVCGWLAVAFATESMGLYTHELNVAAAAALLLLAGAFLWSASRAVEQGRAAWRPVAAGYVVAIAGLVLIPVHWGFRPLAIGLWFWGLALIARGRGRLMPGADALAIGCVLFGLYTFLCDGSLLTWYGVRRLSDELSRLGRLFKPGFTLGPTFSGVGLLVLALASLTGGFVTTARRPVRFLLFLALTLGLYGSYLVVFACTQPDPGAGLLPELPFWQRLQHTVNPVGMPAVLGCLLSLPVGLYLSGLRPAQPAPEQTRYAAPAMLAAALAAAGSVALLTNLPGPAVPGRGTDGKTRFALYEKGFLNWSVPNRQQYGARSGGMFGNVPLMLRAMGWEGDVVPTIDAEVLAGTDVLFIANQNEPLPEETIRLIDRFVTDGGGLLVLGDHTWRKGDYQGMLLDQPLGRAHMRFNFDSAYYFVGGWLHSLRFWPHETTGSLRDDINEAGSVVGASLRIQYPATPLVVGRYGFADRGREELDAQRGNMDNSLPDPGEPLGDLVLVAAENVGHGRVVVAGDTSAFVNGIQTLTWPFTSRLFRWLARSGSATVAGWRDGLAVALLLGLCVAGLMPRHARTVLPAGAVAMLIVGCWSREILGRMSRPEPLTGAVAVVDESHVGLHSLESWRDDAISGAYLNLMRAGYFTIGTTRFDPAQVRSSEIFLSVAPTREYTGSEIEVLDAHLNSGGSVVLLVGYEEKAGALSLLEHFGLDIANRPRGRMTAQVPAGAASPTFWKAWPILSQGSVEVLAALDEDAVVVRKTVGRGQLIVIGDSDFLSCRNFESEEGVALPNVDFFCWLVENHGGRMPI